MLDDSQLVMLKLESGNYLRYRSSVQCCPFASIQESHYKDVDLCNVTPTNTAIISYGGTSIPVVGKVRLRVWRGFQMPA